MQEVQRRITNRKAKEIFSLICKNKIMSRTELKKQSQMTGSTLTRILEELVLEGLLTETGLGDSTGGRRPILYEINKAYACIFGLDISRTHTKLALFNMNLDKLDSQTWTMNASMTPNKLIGEICVTIRQMSNRHQLSEEKLLGLGIGAVGPLDRKSGTIFNPQFFPAEGWHDINIVEQLATALDIPIFLDNGANMAILGEYWTDSANQLEHLLYVSAGVGIRSAMISNGKIVYGAVDMEGSAGQMIIHTDGIAHRNKGGNYGCWESYASIYALEQTARACLKQGRKSEMFDMTTSPEELTHSIILKALQEQDPLAIELFSQAATYFGIGLANLINILHPQMVILGGALMIGNDLFFSLATQVAMNKTHDYPHYQAVFSRGKLGEDAVATGAAVMVINKLAE